MVHKLSLLFLLCVSFCAEIIFTMKNHHSPVLCLALHANQFLASGAKNSITLYTDIISGGVLHTHQGLQGAVTAITVVKMENRLVAVLN